MGGGLINFPTRHIRWIKVEPVNCGDIPSGDTTIDDVVKFIHDEIIKTPLGDLFPYTTWDDIPTYIDADNGDFCKTDSINQTSFSIILLNIPHYAIIRKNKNGELS